MTRRRRKRLSAAGQAYFLTNCPCTRRGVNVVGLAIAAGGCKPIEVSCLERTATDKKTNRKVTRKVVDAITVCKSPKQAEMTLRILKGECPGVPDPLLNGLGVIKRRRR